MACPGSNLRCEGRGPNVRDMVLRSGLLALGAVAVWLGAAGAATAHEPVILGESDSRPQVGPLLPDGTVSYAVRAAVTRGEERGFRFRLASGDRLEVQYLIVDEAPANSLSPGALPRITLIAPDGRRTVLAVKERTEFFEPYSKTTYLYLSRTDGRATSGTYQVLIRGRSATPVDVTVAVGYREVPGEVIR